MVIRPVALALPCSTLLERGEPDIVAQLIERAPVLEIRDHGDPGVRPRHRLIYHADASVVIGFSEGEQRRLGEFVARYPSLEMVSLHVPSCYDEPRIERGRFVPGGRRLERSELFDNALQTISWLAGELPPATRISIENNNYFATGAYEDVCDPLFLSAVVRGAGIGFLFDWSHARISAAHMGMSFSDYLVGLPLDETMQVHLSAPARQGDGWVDAHDLPGIDDVRECMTWLASSPNLVYWTPEYYRDAASLLAFCEALSADRGLCEERG